MTFKMTADRWLGLVCLLLAAAVVLLWVPLDTDTGLVERVRRRWELGDALAPTLAGAVLGLAGIVLLVAPTDSHRGLTLDNLRYVLLLTTGLGLCLAFMRWTGPFAADLLGAGEYRTLRDTAPWKYLGFLVGGTLLVAGLSGAVEGRITLPRLLLAVIASAIIAALYDLPFDDLLLPPNGDV